MAFNHSGSEGLTCCSHAYRPANLLLPNLIWLSGKIWWPSTTWMSFFSGCDLNLFKMKHFSSCWYNTWTLTTQFGGQWSKHTSSSSLPHALPSNLHWENIMLLEWLLHCKWASGWANIMWSIYIQCCIYHTPLIWTSSTRFQYSHCHNLHTNSQSLLV